MGLLSQGRPLDWDETKKYAKYVQERGIAQFINIYHKSKDRADAPFKWGDEVEYIIVKFDHQARKTRVSLKAEEVFRNVAELAKNKPGPPRSFWNPEFAAYMVEGTPGLPYGGDGLLLASLCEIEVSMRYRRDEVQRVLAPDETVMSLTSYPRLGCPDFTHPPARPQPETSASGSLFFPDEAIYAGHPRFKTLVRNIRARRRRKVIINLPIFRDARTPSPFVELFAEPEARKAAKPNHVYMDAMGFGMGCCCLQLTMQATHLEEAKVLYDQLAPLTPIALALSAASPVFRGHLTERDCRWDVIASSVDDRTREESSETRALKDSLFRIPKSRYDSISCYLSRRGQKFNDLPLVFDQKFYNLMLANQVEPAVARHIAHLFIRDPITLYKEKLEQSEEELDHFENIQSTNWQTMRFKPPPAVNSPIGWRVEFRPLEAQTSDFENAAYVVFITLLSRVILAYKLNFLMPLTLLDANMAAAQKRDAVREQRFWFRTDISHRCSSKEPLSTVLENCANSNNNNNHNNNNNNDSDHNNLGAASLPADPAASFAAGRVRASARAFAAPTHQAAAAAAAAAAPAANNGASDSAVADCCKLMTVDEIINGRDGFVGVMPIVWHYVESLDDGSNTELINKIKHYLALVSNRASLRLKTTARWMRDFICAHPGYQRDSRVSDEVAYDLLHVMDRLARNELAIPELVGDLSQPPVPSFAAKCCPARAGAGVSGGGGGGGGASSQANSGHSDGGAEFSGQARKAAGPLSNGFGPAARRSPLDRHSRQPDDKFLDHHHHQRQHHSHHQHPNSRSMSR